MAFIELDIDRPDLSVTAAKEETELWDKLGCGGLGGNIQCDLFKNSLRSVQTKLLFKDVDVNVTASFSDVRKVEPSGEAFTTNV